MEHLSVIGFDLGTSQSAGCYHAGRFKDKDTYAEVENELVRSGAVARAENEKYFPSYVQYDSAGGFVAAGMRARLLADGFPRNTVYDSKRLIGRRYDDPEVGKLERILADRGHYAVCDAGGQAAIRIGESVIYPEQAGAEILAEIVASTLQQAPELQIRKMVIAVPAFFKDVQKLKTKEAAVLALAKLKQSELGARISLDAEGKRTEEREDITLIPEPSAAFITYMARGGHRYVKKDKPVLVFDLGAGTLDITIGTATVVKDPLTREEKYTLDILMTHGNTALGGRDMDQKIIEHVAAELGRRGIVPDNRLLWQVKEKAEKAKIDLSDRQQTSLSFLEHGAVLQLTRPLLTDLIRPLLDQCRAEIRESLRKAGLRKGEITSVVLVGGPTYMPCVRALVEEETGTPAAWLDGWDPMLCVAEGAARSCSVVLNEVVPFNYYVAVEMFEGVNVATPVASLGEPANLDRSVELTVPLYDDEELNDIRLLMVEADIREGRIVKAECFQEIKLPLAGIHDGRTRELVVQPQWSTRELLAIRELRLRYGKLRMTCRLTREGLILRPTFSNPATGNQVTYPDLPVWNLGEVEIVDPKAFERAFDEYAQERYVEKLEKRFNENVNLIMRTAGCNRSAAAGMLIRPVVRQSSSAQAKLREEEHQAMQRSSEAKASEIRDRYR